MICVFQSDLAIERWSTDRTARIWEHDGSSRVLFNGLVQDIWRSSHDKIYILVPGFQIVEVSLVTFDVLVLAWLDESDSDRLPNGTDLSGMPYTATWNFGWPAAIRLQCWRGKTPLSSLSFDT
jgi:hypothetical protein